MKKIISFWENQSKNGNTYYTGKLGELELIGFRVKEKKNPNYPDLEFYIKEDKNKTNNKIYTKNIDANDPFIQMGEQVELDITDNLLDD